MMRILAGRLPDAAGYDGDILILCLGRAAETEAAIRSALGQTDLSRHLILFDQGSDAATLAGFGRLIEGREDAVLVTAGANLGVAEGRNRAAALGHGRAILVLDNDATFADATVAARAVALLDAEPNLAVLGFRIMNEDGSDEDHASWGYPEALRPQAAGRFAAATFVGAGHAIRRAAWDAVGGYDATLFFTWEEFDFALRAIDRGWRLMHAGDLAVHHKLAMAARVGWEETRWFLYLRNRLYIARKWKTSRSALLLRVLAYSLRSLRIGLLAQGLAGMRAGLRLPLPEPARPLSVAAQDYLRITDTIWRGGPFARLRREVWVALPSSRRKHSGHSVVTKRP
ncbi:glycosyltransferase family 2 protein [Acidisoma sp. 7E03]